LGSGELRRDFAQLAMKTREAFFSTAIDARALEGRPLFAI
jgi:hypothetical protein